MADNDRLERFADLVVRVGANVQPGSGVLLRSDIAHLEIARAVVERAYAAGAPWVEIEWSDGPVRRSQLTDASIETLTRPRPWAIERTREWAAARGVAIQLTGDPDPHLLDGVDPAKAAAFPGKRGWPSVRRSSCSSCAGPLSRRRIRAGRGRSSASRMSNASGTRSRPRCASTRPIRSPAGTSATAQLAARARALNALELTEVRYRGPGTDLLVGLVPDSRWTGGSMEDPDGIPYLPNIPTEEVFASPDRRRADGTISLTKPVISAARWSTG